MISWENDHTLSQGFSITIDLATERSCQKFWLKKYHGMPLSGIKVSVGVYYDHILSILLQMRFGFLSQGGQSLRRHEHIYSMLSVSSPNIHSIIEPTFRSFCCSPIVSIKPTFSIKVATLGWHHLAAAPYWILLSS